MYIFFFKKTKAKTRKIDKCPKTSKPSVDLSISFSLPLCFPLHWRGKPASPFEHKKEVALWRLLGNSGKLNFSFCYSLVQFSVVNVLVSLKTAVAESLNVIELGKVFFFSSADFVMARSSALGFFGIIFCYTIKYYQEGGNQLRHEG